MRVAIIGAGPSGLFAACRLAAASCPAPDQHPKPEPLTEILVLEKKARPGLKLLSSGAGQCNLTHAGEINDFLRHYGDHGRFLRPSLYGFTNDQLLSYMRDRGLEFFTEENGKVFPSDKKAASVLRALLSECERLGVRIETESRVETVEREGGTFLLRLAGSRPSLNADKILIATGGASYPATGSEGDGYRLAASFGHRIVEPRPALASVLADGLGIADLAGLSFRGAGLVVRRGGKKVAENRGDIVITHEGFSGPGVLDLARDIRAGDELVVDFTGEGSEAFRARFEAELAASSKAQVRTALAACGLTKSLASFFCRAAGLPDETTGAELRRESRLDLIRRASESAFSVRALGGFAEAMVTAGGVDLAEVDPKTMESRLVPGLFFAGEVLDYDGDTGGYNLQAAFSTGDRAAAGMALTSAPFPRTRFRHSA